MENVDINITYQNFKSKIEIGAICSYDELNLNMLTKRSGFFHQLRIISYNVITSNGRRLKGMNIRRYSSFADHAHILKYIYI